MKKFIVIVWLLSVGIGTAYGEEKKVISAKEFFTTRKFVYYPGLLNVFSAEGHYYWQIPERLCGRDFLVTTTLLKGAAREKRYAEQRYGYAGDRLDARLFRMERQDDKLLLLQPFLQDWEVDSLREFSKISGQRATGCCLAELNILAEDARGLLVEITDLLKDDNSIFGLKSFDMELGIGDYLPDNSYLKEVKTTAHSLVVRFVRTYMSVNFFPDPSIESEPVTWEYGISLCLLPEIPMRRRLEDERIGYFTNTIRKYGESPFRVEHSAYISRWRLEPRPEEVEAYRKGELVEPLKPIVYYIDRAIPQWLQPYIKQSVEAWQPAFEQAGFKNAIRAYLEPEPWNDTLFSVDNALFSYISYKTSTVENAYGSFMVDPRSGEIVNGHIGIFHSIAKLVQGLYFSQVSAVDPLGQSIVLPDTLLGKLIQYVVCHEVGHTLGLKHNFRGSSAFSVKQLRDQDFLHLHGYGASIMDYMRFNYAVQPEDEVDPAELIPRVGPYDCLAIAWGYRYFPEMTEVEETEYLRSWLDEKVENPQYRYNSTDDTDVLSLQEDLGENQMQTNALAIKNMQRLMKSDVWEYETGEMNDEIMKSRYLMMLRKFQDYVEQALMNIRGKTEKWDMDGQRGSWLVPISKLRQKEALSFLDRYVCTPPEWLFRSDFFLRFQIDERLNMETVYMQLTHDLVEKLRIEPTAEYSQEEFLADVRHMIFKEWEQGNPVGEARKSLQRMYIENLKRMAKTKQEDSRVTVWVWRELREILKLAEQYAATMKDKRYPYSVIMGIENWEKTQL